VNSSALRTKLAPAAIAFGALTGVVAAPLISVTAAVAADGQYGEYTVSTAENSYTVDSTVDGVAVTVGGLKAGDTVQVFTGTEQSTSGFASSSEELTADDSGVVTARTKSSIGYLSPGTHTIEIRINGEYVTSEAPAEFQVTGDSRFPTYELGTDTITADDFVNKDAGVPVTGKNLPEGEWQLLVTPIDAENVTPLEIDLEVVEGAFSTSIIGKEAGDPDGYVGEYSVQLYNVTDDVYFGEQLTFTVTASDDDDETESPSPTPTETETASPTPTPTEDDDANEDEWTWNGAPLEVGLNLESDRVTPEKFVDEGVAFAVRGCEPGQDVTFEVRAGRDDVRPYTETVSADENGIAVHGVKGLDADQAEAYIGEYTVTATCGENTWTDAFTVGYGDDDANPGGDDADENDNAGGNDLPRTGTELTGLAAGAGLLVIGAATMMLTRRRGAKTGPADI